MIQPGSDNMSNKPYALMQQHIANDHGRSPLQAAARRSSEGSEPVRFREFVLGHLVIRGTAGDLQPATESVLGMALPIEPLTSANARDRCMRWVSPDEWLLTAPADELFDLESRLRSETSGHVALVNVSGGQTVLQLEGNAAIEVLMKSTGYDVHPLNFAVGKVVTTTLGRAQVLLRRSDEMSYELVIRRSFADYLFAWLQDAAAEFGVVHEE
ncbi:MAG: sarcosine oxidase subunit gamma [Dinoroseobacter sp.]|jgi:sarcosine oxidase subunit gamma